MMKRILSLCAAAALMLSLLSACAGSSKESAAPSTPAESTQEPSNEPAGGKVDLAAFAQTVQQNHEFASLEKADPEDPEMGELFQNSLDNWYPGLTGLDLEQMEIYLAMVSFSGGELALVQAKSPEDAAKVKEVFQARLDSKTTDGPGNYPEELEMWKKYGKVADNGNYVMLVNHEDSAAIVDEFNALFQ